jgi:hypothetical protein
MVNSTVDSMADIDSTVDFMVDIDSMADSMVNRRPVALMVNSTLV